MHFTLVDRVLESSPGRIVTLKNVSLAEEYLADHFPTFPVLPGVFMLEAMVQAARRLLETRDPDSTAAPWVLGRVRAVKYGRFVRPGETMRIEIDAGKAEDGSVDFKGQVLVIDPSSAAGAERPVAASGRFTLRPARLSAAKA